MISKKKKLYLRAYESPKKQERKIKFKSGFINALLDNRLSLSAPMFLVISAAVGIAVYFVYLITTKYNDFALFGGLFACLIPMFIYKTPAMMGMVVDEALAYKMFISTLQSALKATNSTREAMIITANEKNLDKAIHKKMVKIVSDLKMGDSIEEALSRAIDEAENVYFKMALTIIKINHNVGTSVTIDALENIQKTMDNRLSNMQLLKDKINSAIAIKSLFLVGAVIAPILQNTVMGTLAANFYSTQMLRILMIAFMGFAYAGQLIIDLFANKAMKNL